MSTDNGDSWLPEFRLTDDSAYTRFTDVAVSDDTVYVVYYSQSQPGVIDQGLYFRRYDPEPQGIHDITPTPSKLSLTAYPNPFNSECQIGYTIPILAHVKIDIYNIVGQKITTLIDEDKSPGEYRVTFKADQIASGVYYYRIRVGEFSETKPVVLLR